jgi:hypothetical protein
MKEIRVLLSSYFFPLEYVMYHLEKKKFLSICRFVNIMLMFQNVDHCINK